MRIAILADIHANAFALEAVDADATEQGIESFWVLGDVIGYGPHSVVCVEWLREFVTADHWVIGNHEAIFADLLKPIDAAAVNSVARKAIELNREALAAAPDAYSFCQETFALQRAKPLRIELRGRQYTLVHSGQADHLYRYIYAWNTEILLEREFELLQDSAQPGNDRQVQWFGHTHVPTLVRAQPDGGEFIMEPEWIEPDVPYKLDERLTVVNPGSVGQPRDGCRHAAYAILDTDSEVIVFRRVAYDWTRTADDLNAAGYPDQLVARLRDAPQVERTPRDWRYHFEELGRRFGCNGLR